MRKSMIRLNERLALGRAMGAQKKMKKQYPMKFSESVSKGRKDKVDYRGASLLKTMQNEIMNDFVNMPFPRLH